LGASYSVVAAGNYAGRVTGQYIDDSGHEATRMDVFVNRPQDRVALMVSAYEPTVWNIHWTATTEIVAVLVTGYHRQAVAGLGTEVPLVVSTFHNRGACGHLNVEPGRTAWLAPLARKLFGREVTSIHLADEGEVQIGNALPGASYLQSLETPAKAFYLESRPMVGTAALEHAERDGSLRRARNEDHAAWLAARNNNLGFRPSTGNASGDATASSRLDSLRAYAVLKPFAFPPGLQGAHSASFYVLPGVPIPVGDRGHSTVFDIASGACVGPLCQQSAK
jgi:hypothetical protein